MSDAFTDVFGWGTCSTTTSRVRRRWHSSPGLILRERQWNMRDVQAHRRAHQGHVRTWECVLSDSLISLLFAVIAAVYLGVLYKCFFV